MTTKYQQTLLKGKFCNDRKDLPDSLKEHEKDVVLKFRYCFTPKWFEAYISKYFENIYEYTMTKKGRGVKDQGVDIKWYKIVNKKKLNICMQCKKYSKRVWEKEMLKFYEYTIDKCSHKIFITSSQYTQKARAFAKRKNINLIGLRKLVDMEKSFRIDDFILNSVFQWNNDLIDLDNYKLIYKFIEENKELINKVVKEKVEEEFKKLDTDIQKLKDEQQKEELEALRQIRLEFLALEKQVRNVRKEIAIKEWINESEVFPDQVFNLLIKDRPSLILELSCYTINQEIVDKYGEQILDSLSLN